MFEPRLALYTFGQFVAPYESQQIKGFRDAEPHVLEKIENASGFLGRSGYDDEVDPPVWGEQVFPKYWQDNGDGWAPSTLSLWDSLEAALAACYHGLHGQALKRGREWNVKPDGWPNYVAWWVAGDHRPDWSEAVSRLEHLGDHGPSPTAFTFKTMFGPDGQAARIDTAEVKRLAAENAAAAKE